MRGWGRPTRGVGIKQEIPTEIASKYGRWEEFLEPALVKLEEAGAEVPHVKDVSFPIRGQCGRTEEVKHGLVLFLQVWPSTTISGFHDVFWMSGVLK